MKKILLFFILFTMSQVSFTQNKLPETGYVGIGTNVPSVPLDVIGTIKIQSSNSSYNENLRLLPSLTGDYSSLALGAVNGNSGTGIGQWTLIRYPALNNYMFSLRYDSTDFFNILNNGNVGIGTTTPDSKLAVKGIVHSQEVKVDMNGWSDFVFKKEYNLPTLEEVEKHITEKGHLENIPSEKEVLEKGINLGEMNSKLLQKIEEMTLYIIEQNKKIISQDKKIEEFENEKIIIKNLSERLVEIEKKL